jgi:hypothetical protein
MSHPKADHDVRISAARRRKGRVSLFRALLKSQNTVQLAIAAFTLVSALSAALYFGVAYQQFRQSRPAIIIVPPVMLRNGNQVRFQVTIRNTGGSVATNVQVDSQLWTRDDSAKVYRMVFFRDLTGSEAHDLAEGEEESHVKGFQLDDPSLGPGWSDTTKSQIQFDVRVRYQGLALFGRQPYKSVYYEQIGPNDEVVRVYDPPDGGLCLNCNE